MTLQAVAARNPEAVYTYTVLGFLLVCLVAWTVRERSRAIRMERLLWATRRYASGDLAGRTEVRGPDELGVLASAVEQMALQLRTVGATLQERQEWFRVLLEHGVDVVFTLDRQGLVRFAGSSLHRVLGWTPDQVARRPFDELVHPDDVAPVRAALEVVSARPGTSAPIAFRFAHAHGTWRSLEALGSHPSGWTGQEHFVLSARDVTARERLEAELRQGRETEALGLFAAGAAYDLGTLLTAIQGHASLLLMDLAPADPRREALEEIRKSSERAAGLTRQILAFDLAHALDADSTDLNAAVSALEPQLHRLLGEDVTVDAVLAPSLPPVRAGSRELQQVIVNLVLNARDAMPDGGRIRIETASELVTDDDPRVSPELPPGWYAVLTVRDSGRGIAPEIRDRIFDPLFTTGEAGRGVGLGLSTVYGIVKRAGGHIEVASLPGRGTTFRIHLPEPARTGRTRTAPAVAPPDRAADGTILLVEDDEATRAFARVALEQRGYAVLEARHGDDALRLLAEHAGPVELVIAGLVMSGMSGGELARRLRREHPELPVLFLSAAADGEAPRGSSAGECLPKPFTPEALASRVREVLG